MNRISCCKMFMALLLAGAAVFTPSTVFAQGPAPNRAVPRDEGKNTVGEMSEDVARVRLQKLGYSNLQLTRNGDYWEATGTKDGKHVQVRLHVRTGARTESPAAR
jgi:hypothetical protein